MSEIVCVRNHSDDSMKDCEIYGAIRPTRIPMLKIDADGAEHRCTVCHLIRCLATLGDEDRAIVLAAFEPIDNTGHEEAKDV